MYRKKDPFSGSWNASKINWSHTFIYVSPFALIVRVLRKAPQDQGLIIIFTQERQKQVWFPGLCKMSTRNPIFLSESQGLLGDPAGNHHPLIK